MQFAGIAFLDGQCAKQIMPSRLQINRIGWQKNIMLKGQDSPFLTGSRLKKIAQNYFIKQFVPLEAMKT